MQPLSVGEETARRILTLFGATGQAWLEELPILVAGISERWGLVGVGDVFSGARASFVAPVNSRTGNALVLKVSPSVSWLRHEYGALAHWDGRGAVRVVEVDLDLGAILLERATPGTALLDSSQSDVAATHIFAEAAAVLGSAGFEKSDLPAIASWLQRLDRSLPPHAPPELESARFDARTLSDALVTSVGHRVVLHGDLHHANLLRHGSDSWVVVDPKGIIGPEEAEPAAFLRNPRAYILAHPDPVALLTVRTSIISERLGYEAARVAGWGYVLSVVAAVWALEDTEDAVQVDRWLRCSSILKEVHHLAEAA